MVECDCAAAVWDNDLKVSPESSCESSCEWRHVQSSGPEDWCHPLPCVLGALWRLHQRSQIKPSLGGRKEEHYSSSRVSHWPSRLKITHFDTFSFTAVMIIGNNTLNMGFDEAWTTAAAAGTQFFNSSFNLELLFYSEILKLKSLQMLLMFLLNETF